MKWVLLLAGLAAVVVAAALLRVPIDLRLKLRPNAVAAGLVVMAAPLLHVWLVWRGPHARLRWRALGGRRGVLTPAAPFLAVGRWLGTAWRRSRGQFARRGRRRWRLWTRRAARWSFSVLVRRVRLRRAALRVRHGTGRPDLTGYLCGGYWTLAPIWYLLSPLVLIDYQPDFRRPIFRASAGARVSLPLYCIPLLLYWLGTWCSGAVRRSAARHRRPPRRPALGVPSQT